jgi:hypothetical protein
MGPVDAVKLFFLVRRIQHDAVKEIIMENQAKPGWKTTEFWLTIATQVPVVVGVFIGASNPITLGLGAAATIAYTLSRAWSKSNGAAVALAALDAAAKKAQELPPPVK